MNARWYVMIGMLAAGLVILATGPASAQVIYPPTYGPPAMPYYPYYNPQVINAPYAYPTTFNPWTGTYNYNTGATQVYSSYYQPGRNWAAPGSVQPVYQPTPTGGIQTGVRWVDVWGNPHGNITVTQPNAFGGVDQQRILYSRRPAGR